MKKDSHRERPPPLKIKKPQDDASNRAHPDLVRGMRPPPPFRQPLIIQTFSPEVIQTDPHNFMALVQKLTGRDIMSPLHKRPCVAFGAAAASASAAATGGGGPTDMAVDPNSYNLILQQNQRNVLGLSGLIHNPPTRPPSLPPPPRLNTNLQSSGLAAASSEPRSPSGNENLNLRLGLGLPRSASVWQTTVNSVLSPSKFDFSPSVLPSPSIFMKDFAFIHPTPSLSSSLSSEENASLSSPKLVFEAADGVARNSLGFPSPGPLTKLLTDLPDLSPATSKLFEDHSLSADTLLSPLSRGYGFPPRPPHG